MSARKPELTGVEEEGCASKSHYHHGNLRVALVEAALEILEEEGIAGLGLRSTARRAGVSQTAPYHHFGSKDGLLAAVATEGLGRLVAVQCEQCSGVVPTDEEPSLKVRCLGGAYVRFARAHPELFSLMFGSVIQNREAYPELVEAYSAGYALIEEATTEYLVKSGAHEISVKVAISGAWAIVHGLSHLLNDGKIRPGEEGLPEEDQLVDTILALLHGGLTGWMAEGQARKLE